MNYRLKKEAVPFFKDKLATSIMGFDCWSRLNVDMSALEEVELIRIEYGHENENKTGSSLSRWQGDYGGEFRFTIRFPSMKHKEYDTFSKGKVIRGLMNEIQEVVNEFQEQFY